MANNKKNNGLIKLIPVFVLGVLLVVSIVFNVIEGSKIKKINESYEKLSLSYDSLGKDMLSARNDAINNENRIDVLEAEKEELLEKIDNYATALKLANNNIYLSESHFLAGKSVNILKAVAGDLFGVDASQYYAFYSKNEDAYISFYGSDERLIETKKYDRGETYFIKLPSDCASLSVTNDGGMVLVSTGINVSDNSMADNCYFYVVAKNSPVNLSVSEAVELVKENGTVLIFPGEYEETVSVREKEVNICGVGCDECVLYSYDNDYENPPLEISAGKVSDITIYAKDDGRGLVGPSKLAYAVHSDFDYMYGRNLTFENCNIISDFNAGAGIGLRGNGTLTFTNCALVGYYHGLFVHDSKVTSVGGEQNLVVDSCVLTGVNGDVALALSSCVVDSADVNVLFVNNTLNNLYSPESENLFAAVNEDLKHYDGFYMGLKNFHLNEESSGNNVEDLNY